ncbi:MAG TPA: pilin [Candidatus Nitrosotenuis sp.]|nr:pilin [Candidatus Nitrosotenuis sp.]
MLNAKINILYNGRKHLLFAGFLLLASLLFMAVPEARADHCGGAATPEESRRCRASHSAPTPGSSTSAECTTTPGNTNVGNEADGDTTESTSYCFNGKKSDVGINDLIVEILRFLSIAVGIAVVAGITVGGITYSLSRGNPSQVQKGVTIITNSVIGLILYFLMFAIINFLIPGGILK